MQLLAMLFVAFGFILGTVIGLPAFLLRRGIKTPVGRIRLVLILSLLAIVIAFFLGAGVLAVSGETVVQCDTFGESGRCNNLLDSEGVRTELWLRSMLPPAMRGTCMLGNLDACSIIQENPGMIARDTSAYVMLWLGSFLAAAAALLVSRFATRHTARYVH